MGRPGNVPSPTGTLNVPAHKTKPLCDRSNPDIDEEDRDFHRQVAQMMNKQAPSRNERPDPDPPGSIEPARIGTLISESPVGSINRTDQPAHAVDTPVAGENCVSTSSRGQSALSVEIYKCTNTVRKLFSFPMDYQAVPWSIFTNRMTTDGFQQTSHTKSGIAQAVGRVCLQRKISEMAML